MRRSAARLGRLRAGRAGQPGQSQSQLGVASFAVTPPAASASAPVAAPRNRGGPGVRLTLGTRPARREKRGRRAAGAPSAGGAHGELHPACPLLVGVPAAGAPAAARSRRRIAGCTTRGRRIPRRATWPRAACARAACPQTRAPAGHRLAPATHTAAGPLMDLAPACGSPGPRRRSRRAVRYPCYQRTRRKREPLSDGGVLGRGPTQPIAPYHAINYNAEVWLSEDGAVATHLATELRELRALRGQEWQLLQSPDALSGTARLCEVCYRAKGSAPRADNRR
jgi:hypothetical protein